jgi:cyclohexa-1,5-dienecarbonyl-CoA hydratase
MTSPIRCSTEHSGEIERIVLDRPKGNVLDCEMLAAIRDRIEALSQVPGPVKLLVFEGAGGNFSFGASVEEHLPDRVAGMLGQFHRLFLDLERLSVPTAAVVRGQCLGGGFELALWCGYVLCEPSARFGVPETKLGVFPPIAALALPWRMSGARSTQMILSGESLEGEEALHCGIADVCAEDAERALQELFTAKFAGKSAVALRAAWRASRRLLADSLKNDIWSLEKYYLTDLMSHRDPVEGLSAFLERRKPVWTHQ